MAGMTEDKLQLLENTKEGLKTAINATGHTVGDVFSEYPSAVTAYKDEVDAGYAQIAAAITDKGVPTEATDTPAQMAANIGQIETGGLPASRVGETEFCSDISNGKVGILYTEELGIVPIMGAWQGLSYSAICANGQEVSIEEDTNVINITYYNEGYPEDIIHIDYLGGHIEYGSTIFTPENIQLFINRIS